MGSAALAIAAMMPVGFVQAVDRLGQGVALAETTIGLFKTEAVGIEVARS